MHAPICSQHPFHLLPGRQRLFFNFDNEIKDSEPHSIRSMLFPQGGSQEFGVGRPYLDRDPPHVGPIDGKEYVDKRGRANRAHAGLQTNKPHRSAVRDNHERTKRVRTVAKARST